LLLSISNDASIHSITSLRVIVFANGNIDLASDLSSPAPKNGEVTSEILFVKRGLDPITPENIGKLLDVHKIQGSPLDSLYHSLRGIWSPALLSNSEWTERLPPKVQQLLTELQSTLSASVRADVRGTKAGKVDLENVSEIFEVVDEHRYWVALKDVPRSPYKSLAKSVEQALIEILSPGYEDLDTLDLASVPELVNKTFDALNNIWSIASQDRSDKYPKKRMQHLFDIIGATLCRYIQKRLSSKNIWRDPSGDVRVMIHGAIVILEQWVDVPKKLTSSFWIGSDNAWGGDAHEDSFSRAFLNRLEHILRIRTLSDELAQLLTKEERKAFQLEKLFKPLEDTNPLAYNPYTEPLWAKSVTHIARKTIRYLCFNLRLRAVADYEQSLNPVEEAVAGHFRRKIAPIMDR